MQKLATFIQISISIPLDSLVSIEAAEEEARATDLEEDSFASIEADEEAARARVLEEEDFASDEY